MYEYIFRIFIKIKKKIVYLITYVGIQIIPTDIIQNNNNNTYKNLGYWNKI